MKKVKLAKFLCYCIVLVLSSCINSFNSIPKETLLNNEKFILEQSYDLFWISKEYKNGIRMNPPMKFDKIYVYLLNSDESNINLEALKNEELKVEFDDYTLDNDDILSMINNNIPIVQMSFHWYDPASESGNNDWVTYTFFFPECKIESDKLVLGPTYRIRGFINSIKYFPYFSKNEAYMYRDNYFDINDNKKDGLKINFNGNIIDFNEKRNQRKALIKSPIVIKSPEIEGDLLIASEDFPEDMTVDEAIEACKELGSGWRLPTISELKLMNNELYMNGLGGFNKDCNQNRCIYLSSSDFKEKYSYNSKGLSAEWSPDVKLKTFSFYFGNNAETSSEDENLSVSATASAPSSTAGTFNYSSYIGSTDLNSEQYFRIRVVWSKTLPSSLELEYAILTVDQKDMIAGKMYKESMYFHPIQDSLGNWLLSIDEMNGCDNNEFNWVKNLPTKFVNINQILQISR